LRIDQRDAAVAAGNQALRRGERCPFIVDIDMCIDQRLAAAAERDERKLAFDQEVNAWVVCQNARKDDSVRKALIHDAARRFTAILYIADDMHGQSVVGAL
jgi:hypothetical protein